MKEISTDTDFVKEYRDKNFTVICSYRPAEYLALLELKSQFQKNKTTTAEKFTEVVKMFNNNYYFHVTVSRRDSMDIISGSAQNKEEYMRLVNGLTFYAQNTAYLLTEKKDTIHATIYDFQRNYGLSPNANFLFAFPKPENNQDKHIELAYDGRIFGIIENIKFGYSFETLNKSFPAFKEMK